MHTSKTLLLRNARIWTGVAHAPWADAALIADGRFAFVGSAADLVAPAGAEILDGEGRLVVPGFTDAHAHLLGTGMAMESVDLKRTTSAAEAVARVAERIAQTPAGGWVRGAGWDQNLWPGARFPHRRDLDAVARNHPVVLTHTSAHCVWVNSVALHTAAITGATDAPGGGAIDRDADGEPAGILRDAATRLVDAVAPQPAPPERIAAVERAMAHAHSLGVTGAHAMNVGRGELQALHRLNDGRRLSLRVRPFLSAARIDEWFERNLVTGDGDPMLRIGGVKFFADGALGSLTAWMFEPYEGSVDRGFPLQPPEDLERDVGRCLARGLAPAIHAIGDRANHEVLNLLERLRDRAPSLPRRIEHAQILIPEDVGRFANLGVTASVQPIHATEDMRQVDRDWGARGRNAYRFRTLLESGATLAFGSDTPVQTMDPLAGVHAAVTRRDAAGAAAAGWYPNERVTVATALGAYTAGPAAAVRETDAGRIAAGAHGDDVVRQHDEVAEPDPARILEARADLTVVGGEIVYRRAS